MSQHTIQEIKQHIHAENELNKIANKCIPQLLTALKGREGEKIAKKDDTLTKAFKASLPDLKPFEEMAIKPFEGATYAEVQNISISTGRGYSLTATIRLCFGLAEKSGCIYKEKIVYLADLNKSLMGAANDGTINKLYEYEQQPQHNETTVLNLVEKAIQQKKQLEQTQNKINVQEVREIARRGY